MEATRGLVIAGCSQQRRDHIGKGGRRENFRRKPAGLRSPCTPLETLGDNQSRTGGGEFFCVKLRADSRSSPLRSALPRLSPVASANLFRSRRAQLVHR